jgi:hypothetical protein
MRYMRLLYGIEESQKAWEAIGRLPEQLHAMGIRRMQLCRDFTLSPYDFDLLLREIGMKCMPHDVTLRIRIVERHGKPMLRLIEAIPVHGN